MPTSFSCLQGIARPWLALVLGMGVVFHTGDVVGMEPVPARSADLFASGKVWTLHLRLTPERWKELEPKGGANPFDMSAFGFGMFLTPVVMRDGDVDHNKNLSASEFGELGSRWFAAWDSDGDGVLDPKQVREGLKVLFKPPAKEGEPEGGPPPGMVLQARDGKRNGLSGMTGVDFEYVHADLEFEGQTFPDVAVRYKGNGTFMESRASLKRSIKVDLNKYVKGQKLAGVTTLNLHNNVTDAGMMNEVLSYQLYRDAGVPTPRTAYARVYVTVPGKHDRAYFGLYSLVENVDKNFVADRKLSKKSALFKPSMPDLFADLGPDWPAYQQGYDPKTDLTPDQKQRVIAFSRFVAKASDDEFSKNVSEYVDLDEFARFLAVTAWVGDLDSILTTGQNYYLLLDGKTDRFQFIPWDKDHTFGSWIAGTAEQRETHSIREPWDGPKKFLQRTFQVEAFRTRYLAAMTELIEKHARPDRIAGLVQELANAIRPAVKEESALKLTRLDTVAAGKPLPGGPFGFGKETPSMLMFVKARDAAVKDQLAGKSEGHVFGKRKPGDAPSPQDFRPEEMLEPALVKALDADKDKKLGRDEFQRGWDQWFVTWDTAKVGDLPEDQIRKGLNKSLPFSFGPPPKPDATKQDDAARAKKDQPSPP